MVLDHDLRLRLGERDVGNVDLVVPRVNRDLHIAVSASDLLPIRKGSQRDVVASRVDLLASRKRVERLLEDARATLARWD